MYIVPYSPLQEREEGIYQVIWEGFKVVEKAKQEKTKRKERKK